MTFTKFVGKNRLTGLFRRLENRSDQFALSFIKVVDKRPEEE
jgi:hypothetical protein